MPTAYITTLINVHDHDGMAGYIQGVAPTLEKYGGRLSVRGPVVEVLEGQTTTVQPGVRFVVVEFDSVDDARVWWDSPEYQPLIDLRQAAADTEAFLVEAGQAPPR